MEVESNQWWKCKWKWTSLGHFHSQKDLQKKNERDRLVENAFKGQLRSRADDGGRAADVGRVGHRQEDADANSSHWRGVGVGSGVDVGVSVAVGVLVQLPDHGLDDGRHDGRGGRVGDPHGQEGRDQHEAGHQSVSVHR